MHEDGVGPRRGGISQGTHSALSYSPSVMPTALRSPLMAGHRQHPEHTPFADPEPFGDVTLCEALLRQRPNLDPSLIVIATIRCVMAGGVGSAVLMLLGQA